MLVIVVDDVYRNPDSESSLSKQSQPSLTVGRHNLLTEQSSHPRAPEVRLADSSRTSRARHLQFAYF